MFNSETLATTAWRLALIAGIFSALVIVILAANGLRGVPSTALTEGRVAAYALVGGTALSFRGEPLVRAAERLLEPRGHGLYRLGLEALVAQQSFRVQGDQVASGASPCARAASTLNRSGVPSICRSNPMRLNQ